MDAFIELFTAQGPAWLHGVDVVSVFRGVVIGMILAVGVSSQVEAARRR